jgi:hypothetical protein
MQDLSGLADIVLDSSTETRLVAVEIFLDLGATLLSIAEMQHRIAQWLPGDESLADAQIACNLARKFLALLLISEPDSCGNSSARLRELQAAIVAYRLPVSKHVVISRPN